MRKPFFQVVENKRDVEAGRIDIYGVIGGWWDGNDARGFVREFNALEKKYSRIDVHINSPGGSVWDGLPIYNAIRSSKKEVHTYVDGIAFSMGAMITLAAKKGNVHMAKGSMLMLHNVSTLAFGNAKKFRKEADTLDRYDDVLGELIADRTGKTLDEVRADYMDYDDHFFTPTEAKDEGLIDVIESYEAEDMPDNVRDMPLDQVAAWYDGRADAPSESFMQQVISGVKSAVKLDKSTGNMFGNKFSKLTALAKVAAGDVTAEQVAAVNTEIAEAEIEGVTLVLDSELEKENNNLVAAQERVTELEGEASAKDTKIAELEAKVAKLEGKPATTPATPVTDKGDNPETGTGEGNQEDAYMTSVDIEYQQIWGD